MDPKPCLAEHPTTTSVVGTQLHHILISGFEQREASHASIDTIQVFMWMIHVVFIQEEQVDDMILYPIEE